jgi:hypothetical protein
MADEPRDKPFFAGFTQKLGDAAKRNLNGVLDAVDGFEKRGGFTRVIEDSRRLSHQALLGGPYDGKSLARYYANLEVEMGADKATVKRSYRRLMRKFHPDRHSGDPERERLATEISQELTRAYDMVMGHLERR